MHKLAVTLGDINGIGPEIALKSACDEDWPPDLQLVLTGPRAALKRQAYALGYKIPPEWRPGAELPDARVLSWDPDPAIKPACTPGKIDPEASLAAAAAIRAAVAACMEGEFDGIVTAPISKEGFQTAGLDVPGHTEMLAQLTGTSSFAMLLAGGGLRVVLATRHMSLRSVASSLTSGMVAEAIELAAEGLPWLGAPAARIGVCGLNPHAGDGGALGDEEQEIIMPAIESARAKGIEVDDIVPADVIFYKALRGMYDVVIAMYHDQGLGPLKMIAFDQGINITLGLPILRSSPDHGTAFDIAGQGRANPSSMVAALRLANCLARKENPWRLA
jgi:4-hydroxythreonine-4-phosphate dehydrogenase